MKSVRILLYAVNGLGLGHITRLLAIAKYIRRYALILGIEPEIVFLSTSEVDTLPFAHGFPVFKIPSKNITRMGGLQPQRYQKMAKMMIWNCISTHAPDILVVDTFATGSFDELYDVMDFGFQKVFIYRPRKDKSKLWKNPILKAYNKILYIDEGQEETTETNAVFEDKIHYLNTIVQRNRSEMLTKKAACKQLGLDPNKPTACLMAGGGGDKENQLFFERMLPLLEQFSTIQFVVGAGPLYKGAEIPSSNARWFYRPELAKYWNAFDFVISAGGYNSVNELRHAQIPVLFFAQQRLYDDQQARIDKLFEAGTCLKFNREDEDAEVIKAVELIADPTVQEALRTQLKKANVQNDAPEAALQILSLKVPDAEQLEVAEELLDMHLLQQFLDKGITERIFCKVIYAGLLLRKKIENQGLPSPFDNEAILAFTQEYLTLVLQEDYPTNEILPLLFRTIKENELGTIEALEEVLFSQIKELQYS